MPLATDPQQTYKIVLTTDRDNDPTPAFVYRYATIRQMRQLNNAMAKAMAANDDQQMPFGQIDELLELLAENLVCWENMPIEFDAARLDEIINLAEAFEILLQIMAQRPGPADKKKLESPSPCATDKSATTAPELAGASNDSTGTTVPSSVASSVMETAATPAEKPGMLTCYNAPCD